MNRLVRGAKIPFIALSVVALVALSPATASADTQDPVGGLLGQVKEQTDKLVGTLKAPSAPATSAPAASSKAAPGAPSSDSDSAGNETTDPSAPDHGAASVVRGRIGTQDLAEVGGNRATVNDDDSTTADSTVLAVGGQEILGTHSGSAGPTSSHLGDPLQTVCTASGGGACLALLYTDTASTDDGSTSHASSRSGLADVCLGGTATTTAAPCTGPIHLGAATSQAAADRDQRSGRTTASSLSDVATLCLVPDPVTGCSVGADALRSQGRSSSGGATPTATRSSSFLGLGLLGQQVSVIDPSAPADLSILPGCASPSLLCVFANQGETFLGTGLAGTAQDALKTSVLGGVLDVVATVASTETLVHNDGGDAVEVPGQTPGSGSSDPGPTTHHAVPASGPAPESSTPLTQLLPNTGGPTGILLVTGLLLLAGGAFVTAYGRRVRPLAA